MPQRAWSAVGSAWRRLGNGVAFADCLLDSSSEDKYTACGRFKELEAIVEQLSC